MPLYCNMSKKKGVVTTFLRHWLIYYFIIFVSEVYCTYHVVLGIELRQELDGIKNLPFPWLGLYETMKSAGFTE